MHYRYQGSWLVGEFESLNMMTNAIYRDDYF